MALSKKELKKWEILKSKRIIDNKYLKVRQDTVRLPDGTIYNDYYVREEKGWSAIFCLTEDGKVVLNRQYKHGIGEIVLELPAGRIEEGESPEESIKRELEEETGYKVEGLELVGEFISSSTSSTGRVWVYLGRGAKLTGKKVEDAREIVNVELATPKELLEKVRKGEIKSQGHVAAIYLVLDKLGILK